MTTSIPEAPNSGRTWDYRFCWLRDAFFVVRALNSLSEVGTMEDYLRWLGNVVVQADGGHIQPLFGIGLELELPEAVHGHLGGYRGMGPVRVGNQAQEHFQHDVYGNVVLGAAQAFHDHRLLHRAGPAEFLKLEAVGEQAIRSYDKPDAGMWELRTRARVHTSSALMCWAACDRLGKIAVTLKQPERASYWSHHAQIMRERILRESWSEERRAFAESFGGRDLDASVLLMIEVGFIEPKDPRFVATVDALEKYLCDGPYMRRYEAPDDFGKPETAFNICTFWRIDALARIGRKDEARAIFETMLAARNHVGLLSEDTPSGHRRDVGQLSADLFDGRHHQRRRAPVGPLGVAGMSRLVVVSNRVADPRKSGRGRRPGGGAGRCAVGQRRAVVRLERHDCRGRHAGRGRDAHAAGRQRDADHRGPVPRGPRQLLPGLQQRRALAGVPLPARPGRFRRRLHRRLPARQPAASRASCCRCCSPTTPSGSTTTT